MRRASIYGFFYVLGKGGGSPPFRSVNGLGGGVKPAASSHWPQGFPLWRSEMFKSEGLRRFSLAVAAAAFFTLAGCSNQATDQPTKRTPAPVEKAAAAKTAPRKPPPPNPATNQPTPPTPS